MHNHSHHGHTHVSTDSGRMLGVSVLLVLAFAVIEALAGWWAGSLALLGDAGHMVSDATALCIALLAVWIARRPPSARHSYGLVRMEAVAALVNGLFMLVIVIGIVVAAIDRLQSPRPVAGATVMGVAALGLVVNVLVMVILSRGEQNLNTRGALLHVMGDLLGSVAALISGAVIHFSGWVLIDPILSLVICLLILYSSLHLLREVFHVLMEGVPHHLVLPDVGYAMAAVEGVRSVHDLHIWTLSSGKVALSAHVQIDEMAMWTSILEPLSQMLRDDYDIHHITLQPEPAHAIISIVDRPAEK